MIPALQPPYPTKSEAALPGQNLSLCSKNLCLVPGDISQKRFFFPLGHHQFSEMLILLFSDGFVVKMLLSLGIERAWIHSDLT